ncbi:two-component system response regulator [Methylomonas koyamae]|uniref:Two-component system response regulator n=1 Tax=Methylomonas koyamae TaxID=702114 RepID=A0A177NE37_9GAMM|nr:HD domain-containing phosphohydrolase [Methylomonas koyamae]OAI16175.1 two-component system response regulator [Methylomonas koyamae]
MKDSHKLLLVDDEPNNLKVLQQILKDRYELIFAINGEKALAAARDHGPDLILLDIMMPDMDGYQVCTRLKADATTAKIPVIFVTAMGETENEAYGFDVGAVDYIQKPVSGPIVLRRVQTHLSLVRVEELDDLARAAIEMLGAAGHYNDPYTGDHIWRMAAYSAALARAAGWSPAQVEMIKLAAPTHDTGKIGIPHAILKAATGLAGRDWEIMKSHSQIGYDILSKTDNPVFKMAAEIALYHHERWDGGGYPAGLAGTAIPESARIVAIADVFDALSSKRPYKESWPLQTVLDTMRSGAGSHFDPRLLELFMDIMPEILALKAQFAP